MNTTQTTAKQKLARAIWLAFQASAPMGMGFLHSRNAEAATEETLGGYMIQTAREGEDGSLKVYADYLLGRMMKTGFEVSKDGVLKITPEVPRHDYQSWAGDYATASDLISAVEKSFA